MALKSFRITKKELETYYDPKTSNYSMMVESINYNGYGQIIEQYIGDEVLNTYYNIWDTKTNSMVVYEKLSGAILPEAEAGPTFFGVSANDGLAFLNGTLDISGLRKLKYCDACSDGNGLKKPVIENFKQRFTQVKELVFGNNLLEGFLFYDRELPKYQSVFPAVKIDDGVNVTFQFKNVNGTDLTPQDVSTITGKPVAEIELSVDTAPIIKPQEGANTVIISCCEKSYYVIPGQYTIGSILYTDSLPESYCWYVESLTKDLPSVEGITFTNGGRSCKQCVYENPCPTPCEELYFAYSTDSSEVCDESIYDYYNVNWDTSEIFYQGSCGNNPARPGYYYDGKMIYYYDGYKFSEYGKCRPTPTSYFDLVDISSDNFNRIWSYTNSPLQQLWSSGANNFRFMYDSTYVQLSIRINSSYDAPLQGEVSNTAPKEYGFSYAGPGNTYLINLGYYLTIGCDINFHPTETTTIPIEVQGNFGDKINPNWQTIGTFNATIIIPRR
jgi:hypothetical protein